MSTGDYSNFKYFLENCESHAKTELTIEDLRNNLKDSREADLLNAFNELSIAEGSLCFTVSECLDVLHTKEFLRARPWLMRVFAISTVLVVAKAKRHTTVLKRVSSLTSCTDLTADEPPVQFRKYRWKRVFQYPIFVVSISALQLTFFLHYCANHSCQAPHKICQLPCNSTLVFDPHRRRDVWRYLSYALVHDGFLHLSGNIVFQIGFGLPLEVVYPWWRVMVIYVCGILSGPLVLSLFNPLVYLAGSSSGVYALQTAHLANILVNFRDMEYVGMRACTLVGVYGNDLYMVLSGPHKRQHQYLSYAGHYGGALAGLFVGVPVLKSIQRGNTGRFLDVLLLSVFNLAIFIGILWNMYFG